MTALERAAQAHADVKDAEAALEGARDALEHAVRKALDAGHTQAAIGAFLGISQRRVSDMARGRYAEAARKREARNRGT